MFQRKAESQSADETQKSGRALAGRLSGGFSSLLQRSGSLVDRVTDSVKEVAGTGLHRQAIDARERGNLAAAYYLIQEDHAARAEDMEAAATFWDIALEYDHAHEAADAACLLIRRHAAGGALELASQYWIELCGAIPDSLVEPATFARILPTLLDCYEALDVQAGKLVELADANDTDEEVVEAAAAACSQRDAARDALVRALRGMVDERNTGLTPGLAMHAAELARELDPESALRAARHALACDDLHQAKRRRMQLLIAELDPNAEPVPDEEYEDAESPDPVEPEALGQCVPARNHPLFTESPPQPVLSDEELHALRERLPPSRTAPELTGEEETSDLDDLMPPPGDCPGADVSLADPLFLDIKVIPGEPIALERDAISLSVDSDRSVRVEFDKIEAVAVGEVWGLGEEPVLIIDLLLNWRSGKGDPLRTVRMRTDCFAPEQLIPDEPDRSVALRAMLAVLLEGSSAIPLPDPDGALGLVVPVYESLLDYEREVLQLRV